MEKDKYTALSVILQTNQSFQEIVVNHDRIGHWDSLWTNEDVFYCTVGGFKGLERPVVVLAIDGFHDDSDKDDVLYVGMSRARDKLVVVANHTIIQSLRGLEGE
jgi:superfamily I DNA/RNA helicase